MLPAIDWYVNMNCLSQELSSMMIVWALVGLITLNTQSALFLRSVGDYDIYLPTRHNSLGGLNPH